MDELTSRPRVRRVGLERIAELPAYSISHWHPNPTKRVSA